MMAALKSRIASALPLFLLVFTLILKVQAADAPLHKLLPAPVRGSEIAPQGAGRLLIRQEILAVIQAGLERRGISAGGDLRAEDLTLQASIPATKAATTGLRLESVLFDARRREIVFEIRAADESRFLPFQVTLRSNSGLVERMAGALVRAGLETESPAVIQGVSHAIPKPLVLAKPGTSATLMMLGQNIRITMSVVPLQPGVKGQSILVRDVSSARILTAEVVDLNLLQANF